MPTNVATKTQSSNGSLGRVLLALLIGAIASILFGWTVAHAHDEPSEWTGIVTVMPEGMVGDWEIGGMTFTADSYTEFDDDEGSIGIGVCAEVEYDVVNSSFLARDIERESDDECAEGKSGEWYGVVTAIPEGRIGTWVIGGKSFVTTSATEYDEDDLPLAVGVCARVEYKKITGTMQGLFASEIESLPADECGGHADDDLEYFGLIEQMPPGGAEGIWLIGGKSFEANGDTEFEEEHGPFEIGACVKVESESSTPTIAEEIATKHQYRCSGDGDAPPKSTMFGVVEAFPPGLIGSWTIGGTEFVASSATEFEQDDIAFDIGVTVKVKFYTDANDENHALEIETVFDCSGNKGHCGKEGHSFGVIEVLPQSQSLIGEWTIGGVVFEVDASTELEDDVEECELGTRVRIEYYVDPSGKRIAEEIEITSDKGGAKNDDHMKYFGFVDSIPKSGFVGIWVISGADFRVTEKTGLKESHGLVGKGAYVEIEYSVNGGQRFVYEIETQVPPGAGEATRLGMIVSIGSASAISDAAVAESSQWIIGDTAYTVIPATQIINGAAGLSVGDLAIVNSYATNDGQLIATNIRGVTQDDQVMLPALSR